MGGVMRRPHSMSDYTLAIYSRREGISSRSAEFQTLHSSWHLDICQGVLLVRNTSPIPEWFSLSYAIISSCHPACYRTDHRGSPEGSESDWVSSGSSPPVPGQAATKVCATPRSSSAFSLGSAQYRPVPAVPTPKGFFIGSRFMPNQFQTDSVGFILTCSSKVAPLRLDCPMKRIPNRWVRVCLCRVYNTIECDICFPMALTSCSGRVHIY